MFYTFFAQYIYNMLYQNIVHISIDLIKKIEICKRWMSRRAGDQDEARTYSTPSKMYT